MRTVSTAELRSDERVVEGLPSGCTEALGELAGAAKEALLAVSVGVVAWTPGMGSRFSEVILGGCEPA